MIDFTIDGLRVPPLIFTGRPGDVMICPTATNKAVAFTAPGVAGEQLRCYGVDAALATVEARFCDVSGGSPGAWTNIGAGSGLAVGASAGTVKYFQLRVTFAARADLVNHRAYCDLRITRHLANGA